MAKISPDLEREVQSKAVDGWSAQRIADWLLSDHGIQISRQGVDKRIAERRATLGAVTAVAAREQLLPQVGTDIARLEKHAAMLDQMTAIAAEEALATPGLDTNGNPKARPWDPYIRLAEQLRKMTDTKLHYAGAGTPETDTDGLAGLLALGFGATPPRAVDE